MDITKKNVRSYLKRMNRFIEDMSYRELEIAEGLVRDNARRKWKKANEDWRYCLKVIHTRILLELRLK